MTDNHLIHQLRNSKGWPTLGNAAADRIEALIAERDRLAGLLGEAKEALRWYHDQMCEGFCKDLRYDSTYCPEMDDECSGCKARATLAEMEKTDGHTD